MGVRSARRWRLADQQDRRDDEREHDPVGDEDARAVRAQEAQQEADGQEADDGGGDEAGRQDAVVDGARRARR